MSPFSPESVLAELERGEVFVDTIDVVRLLAVAGFEEELNDGRYRFFSHVETGERLYLRAGYPVPPHVGPVIAEKVKNYWP